VEIALYCLATLAWVPLIVALYPWPRGQRGDRRWHAFCAAWKEAAEALGLRFGKGDKPGLVKMLGRIDAFDIVVDTAIEANISVPQIELTRFQVFTFGAIPKNLTIERVPPHKRGKDDRRILIGDPRFDEEVSIYGDEIMVRALLDQRTRAMLVEHVANNGFIVHNSTVYTAENSHVTNPSFLVTRVRAMLRLAEGLALADEHTAMRLLETALAEEIEPARQRAFHLLFAHFATHPEVQRAVPRILRDPNPLIRLLAAQAEGEAGLARVEAMAVDPEVPQDVRVVAYCYLVQFAGTHPDVRSMIERALATERTRIIATIIRFSGTVKCQALLPYVAHALDQTREPAIALACAEAVLSIGGPEVEPLLIRAMAWPDATVRVALVRALGKVGTARSVEVLLPHAQALLIDGVLKDAAKAALRDIRARLLNAESGCLSLVQGDDQRGALSLRVDEGGALSIARRDGSEVGALAISKDDARGA
jgi:hypothetical protein